MPANPMNPTHILNNFLFSLGNFTSVDPGQAINQMICHSECRRYNHTIKFQSSNFKIILHELIGFSYHCAKLFPILIYVKKYKYYAGKNTVVFNIFNIVCILITL
jgi:hypothetical protein